MMNLKLNLMLVLVMVSSLIGGAAPAQTLSPMALAYVDLSS